MPEDITLSPAVKIAAALRALPGANGDLIPETIEALATRLADFDPRTSEAQRQYLRRFEPASYRATEKELATLTKAATTMAKALDALHKPARDALGWAGHAAIEGEISRLQTRLRQVTIPPDLPIPPKRMANARQDELVAEVAKAYKFLTGTAPTRTVSVESNRPGAEPGGAFHELLSDVFAAFNIETGADNPARKAIAAMVFNAPFSSE